MFSISNPLVHCSCIRKGRTLCINFVPFDLSGATWFWRSFAVLPDFSRRPPRRLRANSALSRSPRLRTLRLLVTPPRHAPCRPGLTPELSGEASRFSPSGPTQPRLLADVPRPVLRRLDPWTPSVLRVAIVSGCWIIFLMRFRHLSLHSQSVFSPVHRVGT